MHKRVKIVFVATAAGCVINIKCLANALHEKCLYSELFWSSFSRIWTEYEKIPCISPHSVQMRENVDESNSEYGLFLCSDDEMVFFKLSLIIV